MDAVGTYTLQQVNAFLGYDLNPDQWQNEATTDVNDYLFRQAVGAKKIVNVYPDFDNDTIVVEMIMKS